MPRFGSVGFARSRPSDPPSDGDLGTQPPGSVLSITGLLCSSIMPASIASLDSSTGSEDDWEVFERRQLDREWEESMEELQKLLSFILLPFLGKHLGRRWSHWGQSESKLQILLYSDDNILAAFARYTRLGLGKSFFLGERPFAFLTSIASARA